MSCTLWVKLIETSHKVNKSKSVSSSGKTELTPLFLVGSFLKNNLQFTAHHWLEGITFLLDTTALCPAHTQVSAETNLNRNLMNLANSLSERLMCFSFVSS